MGFMGKSGSGKWTAVSASAGVFIAPVFMRWGFGSHMMAEYRFVVGLVCVCAALLVGYVVRYQWRQQQVEQAAFQAKLVSLGHGRTF